MVRYIDDYRDWLDPEPGRFNLGPVYFHCVHVIQLRRQLRDILACGKPPGTDSMRRKTNQSRTRPFQPEPIRLLADASAQGD